MPSCARSTGPTSSLCSGRHYCVRTSTPRKAKQYPDLHHQLAQLGLAYKETGLFKEAIAVLDEAVAKNAGMRPQLLNVYALVGAHAKVVTVCREHLELFQKAKESGILKSVSALVFMAANMSASPSSTTATRSATGTMLR